MTTFQHPTTTALREGQCLRMSVRSGTRIAVTQGRVVLVEAPAWLGETMVAVRTTLDEGQAHCIEKAGWIEMAAVTQAEVRQWAAASAWTAIAAHGAQWLQHVGVMPKAKPLP